MFELFPSRTVVLALFGWHIHWYGMLYFAAFLLAWQMLPRLQRFRALSLSRDDWSRLLSRAVIGVIAGGRLGYVLFYAPEYYAGHPWEIFAIWRGGMSSHGGFVGVTIALLWTLRRYAPNRLLAIADTVVIPAAVGLALGRIGNFINLEVYGIVTTLPWGISIPGVDGLRHPVQLYAAGKDLLIAWICFLHVRRPTACPGRTLALFLMLYGLMRFLIEFLRDQPYGVWEFGVVTLTPGQLLTIPVGMAGMIVWIWAVRHRNSR